MSVWRRLNVNPRKRSLGDCAVRAVAVALGVDWYEAYDLLCAEGRRQCDMPSSDDVIDDVLARYGFSEPIPARGVTAERFCREHPRGVYVLALIGHVATAVDGYLYDLWDSSGERVRYYYRRA